MKTDYGIKTEKFKILIFAIKIKKIKKKIILLKLILNGNLKKNVFELLTQYSEFSDLSLRLWVENSFIFGFPCMQNNTKGIQYEFYVYL